MDKLREFSNERIGEDCSTLSGTHENELFFDCIFCNLGGLTLKDCVLDRSKFTTSRLRDALGFTMTLDCHSFRDVEFSPLLFDLFMMLAYMSKGNDEKREKLLDVVGRDRAQAILRALKETE
jgi:hypothetical protein